VPNATFFASRTQKKIIPEQVALDDTNAFVSNERDSNGIPVPTNHATIVVRSNLSAQQTRRSMADRTKQRLQHWIEI
jgi:hypothetical protein